MKWKEDDQMKKILKRKCIVSSLLTIIMIITMMQTNSNVAYADVTIESQEFTLNYNGGNSYTLTMPSASDAGYTWQYLALTEEMCAESFGGANCSQMCEWFLSKVGSTSDDFALGDVAQCELFGGGWFTSETITFDADDLALVCVGKTAIDPVEIAVGRYDNLTLSIGCTTDIPSDSGSLAPTPVYIPIVIPDPTPEKYDEVKVKTGEVKDITGTKEATAEENPYEAKIDNSNELEKLLDISPEEKQKGVNVWLDVKKIEEKTLDSKEQTILKNKANKEAVKVGLVLDASMFKSSGGEVTQIHKTNGMVEVSFKLPVELKGKDGEKRFFYIMRIHEDESGKLKTDYLEAEYNEETGVCTFKTNKFSTYAICYEDEALRNDKQAFEKYKSDKNVEADKLIKKGDSDKCKKLVNDAKKKISSLTYDVDKSLADNKKVIDDIISKLTKDLESQRKKDTDAKAKANEKKTKCDINVNLKVTSKDGKVNVKWGKVSDAIGYKVYASYCGEDLKCVKTIKDVKKTSYIISKLNGKKVNASSFVKLYVEAYKKVNGKDTTLCKSILTHIVGSANKTYANAKEVKLDKSSYTLKVGNKATIKGKVILEDKNKKALDKGHGNELRYMLHDGEVVSVSKDGKITAKAKGSTIIYVFALNGNCKKAKVTVK